MKRGTDSRLPLQLPHQPIVRAHSESTLHSLTNFEESRALFPWRESLRLCQLDCGLVSTEGDLKKYETYIEHRYIFY